MRALVFTYILLCISYVRGDCQDHNRNNVGIKIGNKRYHLGTYFKANFYTATEFCRSFGMHLASISSREENDGLVKYIKELGYENDRFWTSGNDLGKKGSYNWMSTGAPFIYKNFLAGEPNHLVSKGEEEHCIDLYNQGGKGHQWNDHYCSAEKFFVCESYDCDATSFHIIS